VNGHLSLARQEDSVGMAAARDRRPRSLKGKVSPMLSLALFVLILLFLDAAHGQQPEEYRVKAAFLFHFIQFVDWPADGSGDQNRPITICTVGRDPFDGDLETTLKGKSIGARPLQIRHLKRPEEIQACQAVFITGGEWRQDFLALAPLKNPPILTVGEDNDFVKQGGMIGFCMESNKIRFDVNVDAASRANLKVSSRLLALARTVIGAHP